MLLKNQNFIFTHQVIEKEVDNRCHSHQSQVNFSHLLSQEDYNSRPALLGNKRPLASQKFALWGIQIRLPPPQKSLGTLKRNAFLQPQKAWWNTFNSFTLPEGKFDGCTEVQPCWWNLQRYHLVKMKKPVFLTAHVTDSIHRISHSEKCYQYTVNARLNALLLAHIYQSQHWFLLP